jgi:hypothetical protein
MKRMNSAHRAYTATTYVWRAKTPRSPAHICVHLQPYGGILTWPDVELVVSQVNNAMAPATQLTCLQLPTPHALTRLGGYVGHTQRGISRILRARAYLDLLAFCTPSPPDYMRVISGTGRGVWLSFWLYMSPFSRCHPITIRWQPTGYLA